MSTRTFGSVTVGDALPDLVVAVSATRIVAGAIATRDFMPVHHDREYANQQGAPDIFMNILSDTGWCSRWLTDWAGPDAFVRSLKIRLGVPVFPGHTLTFSGRVTACTPDTGDAVARVGGTVEVTFGATGDIGEHVGGNAILRLPGAHG